MTLYPSDVTENAYNGKDRNALELGFTPQSELWNGRLAIVGLVAYLIWDLNGYSVMQEVLDFIPYSYR
ncbi:MULTISPECIES: high light inducible protein [unclassified Nostoc]|uniref:high light inducible protein n=1 Tax=unclassified Nostoc TaxID=2593658 RepID=UPI002AD2E6E7|nr:high light inducible protein [Nostoc sp. ChiQUE02]MDZ8231034.1 high light inducible protein [Nostoc sp. ChiQUE02]